MGVRYITTIHYLDPEGNAAVEERSFTGLDADAVAIATDAGNCAAEALSENSYTPEGSVVVTVNISHEHFADQ
jgi:hypothetical protein